MRERAHVDEAADPGVLGGREERARALLHDPLERLVGALDDRDQVDDRVAALDGAAQARLVGHVAGDELAAQAGQLGRMRPVRVADERANLMPLVPDRPDDVGTHEARAAGDEDAHQPAGFASSAKFCQ